MLSDIDYQTLKVTARAIDTDFIDTKKDKDTVIKMFLLYSEILFNAGSSLLPKKYMDMTIQSKTIFLASTSSKLEILSVLCKLSFDYSFSTLVSRKFLLLPSSLLKKPKHYDT